MYIHDRSSNRAIHRQASLQWPGVTTVYAWLPPLAMRTSAISGAYSRYTQA
jgi:hypothetical protein